MNWQDYTGGVMTAAECAWVTFRNFSNRSLQITDSFSKINLLDHCVQLVGYNTNSPTPYWIVRNSWNTNWGLNGYIHLAMGQDTCGLTYYATYVQV